MTPFEHPNAFVRRIRPPSLRAFGLVPLVAAVGTMLAFSAGAVASPSELAFRTVLVALATVGAVNFAAGPPRRGDIRIDDAGLHIGGEIAMARDDIVAVHLSSGRSSTVVLVPRRGPALELTLPGLFHADDVLAALGRPTLTAVRFERDSPFLDRMARTFDRPRGEALLVGAIGLALALVSPWLLAAVVAAFGMDRALSPGVAVEVGRDGVLVSGPFMKSRFVPYAEIVHVRATDYGVVIMTLRSGGPIAANVGDTERAAVLLKRVERCRNAAAESELTEEEARQILRDDRRLLGARLPELRQLGRMGDASYRESAISREQLWRIVEDTTLDPTTRLGAAVALSGDLAEPDRARLRVVAEATASPRTRIALEEVAAEASDDARLTEALSALEEEEDRALEEERKKRA